MVRHSVDLNGHLLLGKGEIDDIARCGMVRDPAGDPVLFERVDRQPLRRGPGTRPDEHQHLRHLGGTLAVTTTLERLDQRVDGHLLALQRAVEDIHVALDGAFEDRQRESRDAKALVYDDVLGVKGSADDLSALHRRALPTLGTGNGDNDGPFGRDTVPPRCCKSAEYRIA